MWQGQAIGTCVSGSEIDKDSQIHGFLHVTSAQETLLIFTFGFILLSFGKKRMTLSGKLKQKNTRRSHPLSYATSIPIALATLVCIGHGS